MKKKYLRFKNLKIIRVGYYKFITLTDFPINDIVAEIKEKTTIEIVNTLIREKFISTPQHAANVGISLHKTASSLKYGVRYTQNKNLEIKIIINN